RSTDLEDRFSRRRSVQWNTFPDSGIGSNSMLSKRSVDVDCLSVLLDDELCAFVGFGGEFVHFLACERVGAVTSACLLTEFEESKADIVSITFYDISSPFERREVSMDGAFRIVEICRYLRDGLSLRFGDVFDDIE